LLLIDSSQQCRKIDVLCQWQKTYKGLPLSQPSESADSCFYSGPRQFFSAVSKRSKEPHPGDIVIAMINGYAVVKKFSRQKGRVILQSTKPRYADIEIKESDRFLIAGVVLRIVEGAV